MTGRSGKIAPTVALTGFLLLWWAVPQGMGMEFLSGEVVAVDRDNGVFILRVQEQPDGGENILPAEEGSSPGSDEGEKTGRQSEIVVLAVENGSTPPFLPGCVLPGESVRVWGDFGAAGDQFLASDIRGTRGWLDGSGVRSRLNRGANFQSRGNRAGEKNHRQKHRGPQ